MAKKRRFIRLFDDDLYGVQYMTPVECQTLLLAISAYKFGGQPPSPVGYIDSKIADIIGRIKAEDEAYIQKCNRLGENRRGKKSVNSTEQQVEEQKDRAERCEYKKIQSLWNETCGQTFGMIAKLSESRKSKMRIRANEFGIEYIDKFKEIFERLAASSFCRNGAGSWCTFDWIIKNDNNYVKLLEGQYDRKSSVMPTKYELMETSEQQYVSSVAQNCVERLNSAGTTDSSAIPGL